MIKEICLPLKDYTKYKNISKGMFAISELYLVSLPKFDSKKVINVIFSYGRMVHFRPKKKYWGVLILISFLTSKSIPLYQKKIRKSCS